jgi:aspartyl-tRNA synthetase
MKSNNYRSHSIEECNSVSIGESVTVSGWIHKIRDHGGILFGDIRDRSGLLQFVIDPETLPDIHAPKLEWVVSVTGKIANREKSNPNMLTGDIELLVEEFKVLSAAETPPVQVADETQELEELTRLKYRYLDLRKPKMQRNIKLRSDLNYHVRNFLHERGFLEIETPILTKSTPEGARDFVVPSRLHPHACFALPQSPQLFKQLFMVSGFEKYFQVVKCFRDEDLRADRQPEFTQLDIEASFVKTEDIIALISDLIVTVFSKFDWKVSTPIQRLTYSEAMERFGCDNPDMRFSMEHITLSSCFTNSEFKVFSTIAKNGGLIKGMVVKNGVTHLSRKKIDDLLPLVSDLGFKGVAYIHFKEDGIQSPIAKFLSDEDIKALKEHGNIDENDTLLLLAGEDALSVHQGLSRIRNHVARMLDLIDENALACVWVTDFPLFEKDDEGNPTPMHHPFTAPWEEHERVLMSTPETCLSQSYDIVCNGMEIGGGSIRIHKSSVQKEIFKLLNLNDKEIDEKFGFFVNALKYGTPPHGGIALGLDRVAMILSKSQSIRDVIAFPKTQNMTCPLTDAPSHLSKQQREELHLPTQSTED